MSNSTASMDQHVANMSALRAIVGPEPKEQDLVDLLRKYPSVNQAANAFFDGSAKGGLAQGTNVIDGMPISPPPPPSQDASSTTNMVSVTCPAGVAEGSEIQVQTQQGMMRVTVPKGVTAGTQFLVRLPTHVPLPVAQPVYGGAYPAGPSSNHYQPYPGQQMMMPQQQHVAYAQQPNVVVVQSAPYMYGGYGYGYDPFLGGMMGFAGGMLIADAMFY